MYHYTYITASKSGCYYVGRHSTKKINDNYFGSGKWVKACKRLGVELHKKILYFYDTFENLKKGEEELIKQHIENQKNMNFNSESCGFSCGDLNPARSESERKRRSESSWLKTPEGRNWFSKNNPSKKESVKKLRSESLTLRWQDKKYRELMTKNHHSKSQKFKEGFSVNNPMKQKDVRLKRSIMAKDQVALGLHNSQIKVSCIICRRVTSLPNFSRWHNFCISSN